MREIGFKLMIFLSVTVNFNFFLCHVAAGQNELPGPIQAQIRQFNLQQGMAWFKDSRDMVKKPLPPPPIQSTRQPAQGYIMKNAKVVGDGNDISENSSVLFHILLG